MFLPAQPGVDDSEEDAVPGCSDADPEKLLLAGGQYALLNDEWAVKDYFKVRTWLGPFRDHGYLGCNVEHNFIRTMKNTFVCMDQ